MFSVGMERTINLGNYENIRIGFVESFARSETDPHDAYVKIKAMLDNWVHELPPRQPEQTAPPKTAPPAPTGKLGAVMAALGGHVSRLIITEREDMIILRTRGQLERETWGDIDTLVRGQGGSWRGTKDGLPGKEVHWEIPK
jgi:hypothetical protein